MEDIMEQFGQVSLWILSGAILMALFLSFLQEGGIINEIVQCFIYGICG
ncbi:MAG: hypothetical protein J6C37_02710 [Roseburia sp.]|nr:hypothetical protein [Roseburia sp.]